MNAYSEGTLFFKTTTHTMKELVADLFGEVNWEDCNINDAPGVTRYRGRANFDDPSLIHDNADIIYNEVLNKLRIASNFVAGTTATHFYEYQRAARAEELEAKSIDIEQVFTGNLLDAADPVDNMAKALVKVDALATGGGMAAAFAWLIAGLSETIALSGANVAAATRYDLADALGRFVHYALMAANRFVASGIVPAVFITGLPAVEDAGTINSGSGTAIALPLGNNRRAYMGHNAAGNLTVAVNNNDVVGDVLVYVTTIPVSS